MNTHVLLVAEDDDTDAMLLERAVMKASTTFQMVRVSNGEGVVAYLRGEGPYADRAMHPWPHVLLLDLKMPRVDGFEVLEWLRKNNASRPLPAVVLSSSALKADVQRAYTLGANSYVVKPTAPERLEQLVSALYGWGAQFNISGATT